MATEAPGPSSKTLTLSADGSTAWQKCIGPTWVSIGGTGGSNFGGGTAIIQVKDGDGNASAIAGESWQASKDRLIDFPPYAVNEVRVNLSGSTTPDLDVLIQWSSPYQQRRQS